MADDFFAGASKHTREGDLQEGADTCKGEGVDDEGEDTGDDGDDVDDVNCVAGYDPCKKGGG